MYFLALVSVEWTHFVPVRQFEKNSLIEREAIISSPADQIAAAVMPAVLRAYSSSQQATRLGFPSYNPSITALN